MVTKHKSLNRVPEDTMTDDFTFDGETPSTGVHTVEGKLYCGTYSPTRWFSNDMKPFRDQIAELRLKYQKGRTKSEHRYNQQQKAKHRIHESKIMKAKRQIQELQNISEIAKAKRQIQELQNMNEQLKRNLSALQCCHCLRGQL
jgi:hypothetical protein